MPLNPTPFWSRPRRPRYHRPLLALSVGVGALVAAAVWIFRAIWP